MTTNPMPNLVTPCHGEPIHVTTTYDVECSHEGCRNSWTPSGIADDWNKDTMTEYNEGDFVEAIKGESHIRDRLVHQGPSLALSTVGGTISYYKILGFTIRVIPEAVPVVVLPTEYGMTK